ncbi:hypothetical protein ABZ498_31960 [Streptomyces lavendulocolor]|uniref:hypothetical protein n=1 Tax=Streptomyces lavendulocolor TaxID=67316 RepID=UPI003403C9BB
MSTTPSPAAGDEDGTGGMVRATRTARRMLRRATRRPALALLALLLAVLAASAVACGLTTAPGTSQSMAAMDHVAVAEDGRPTTAAAGEGADRCHRSALAPRMDGRPHGDCDPARCPQVSGQARTSCCDSPGADGVSAPSVAVAPSTDPGPAAWHPPTTSSSLCPDAVRHGPGPPDLHMLQLLRI